MSALTRIYIQGLGDRLLFVDDNGRVRVASPERLAAYNGLRKHRAAVGFADYFAARMVGYVDANETGYLVDHCAEMIRRYTADRDAAAPHVTRWLTIANAASVMDDGAQQGLLQLLVRPSKLLADLGQKARAILSGQSGGKPTQEGDQRLVDLGLGQAVDHDGLNAQGHPNLSVGLHLGDDAESGAGDESASDEAPGSAR